MGETQSESEDHAIGLEEVQVLVVEDEADDARFALDAIEGEAVDVEVEVTPYGKRGLELVEDRSFDCVLLDHRLPRMTGTEFVEEVRGRGLELPIVVLTGRGSNRLREELIEAGADAYLDKEDRDDARIRGTLADVMDSSP